MLSIFTDTLPKSVLAGGLLWAGVSYFGSGPELATRISRVDFVPACEANFKDMAMQAGEERQRSLTMPSLDPMQELAIAQAKRLADNPFMDQLRALGGGRGDIFGIGETADAAVRQMQHAKRAAREAYERSLEAIRQQTATNLASAGDVCGCVADAAIADTRTEWAIYAGTLTLIEPAPVKAFGQRMAQMHRAGGCEVAKAGA